MILTTDDIVMDLNSIGIPVDLRYPGWRWQSNQFECPRHQWAEDIFARAFFFNRSESKENHYKLEKWMCGHISGIAQGDAREMWARTPTPSGHPDCGLAWGCFDYLVGGDEKKPHSITFIDEDHTIYFYEPQMWMENGDSFDARLNLNDAELGSCFGGQI